MAPQQVAVPLLQGEQAVNGRAELALWEKSIFHFSSMESIG